MSQNINFNEFIKRLPVVIGCFGTILSFFFLSSFIVGCFCALLTSFICYEIFLLCKNKLGFQSLKIVVLFVASFGVFSFWYILNRFGPETAVGLVVISSFFDIGGYIFGKLLKGPKLCPKISPNKTWSGFIGGYFLANVCFLYYQRFFDINISIWMLEFLIFVAFVGDLLESLFKRKLQIKDTSDLLAGHGGFLDRFDSIIFLSIVYVLIFF